jgi:acyl-CoA synthetase (AMP-forming)/AMP-acid ligase II
MMGGEMNTIADISRINAENYPDRTATVYKDVHYSFASQYQRALKLASALSSLGCQPHDRVAILAKNCIEYLELYSACELAGYIIAPINYRLSSAEIAFIYENTSPKVCFYGAEYEEELAGLKEEYKGSRHFIRIDEHSKAKNEYADFIDAGEAVSPAYTPVADDAACIIHTSGTTGRPKGAVLTQGVLLGIAETLSADGGIEEDDYGLVMQPLFHVGAKFLQSAHHVHAATIKLEKGFEPALVWQILSSEDITTMQVVPTMLDMLLAEIKDGVYPETKLKTIFYSTAPIKESLLRRGLQVFGQVFLQQYGSTEGGSISSLAKSHHINDGTQEEQRWLTSAGVVSPGVELRIVDGDGKSLAQGEAGEIVVKNKNIMQRYWNDEEATSNTIVDGFLHTGDIGYLDKDGFLYIVDRKKDMIISGGENIYPREIEITLLAHPGVLEVAVIGVPDDRWGEAVQAVVVCDENISVSEEELISYCKEHIASYKKPKAVSFVEALPRIATGKVDKVSLRKPYWESESRSVG